MNNLPAGTNGKYIPLPVELDPALSCLVNHLDLVERLWNERLHLFVLTEHDTLTTVRATHQQLELVFNLTYTRLQVYSRTLFCGLRIIFHLWAGGVTFVKSRNPQKLSLNVSSL